MQHLLKLVYKSGFGYLRAVGANAPVKFLTARVGQDAGGFRFESHSGADFVFLPFRFIRIVNIFNDP